MNSRAPFLLIVRLCAALSSLAAISACNSPSQPSGTPPAPVNPLVLTCPSDMQIDNVKTATQVVSYSPATHSGGVNPISITCSPASGADFPVGPTTVSCTGTDAGTPGRPASCSFVVTLVPRVPMLGVTKFMAYGDSITAGEINNDDTGARCPANVTAKRRTGTFSLFSKPQDVQPDKAYPTLLLQLLKLRYATQDFTVRNEGLPLDDTGNTGRFSSALQADRPEAVLFLQGVIDLTGERAIPTIIANIDHDIGEAARQGVKAFFLSTLTPVLPFSRGCDISNSDILELNDQIRALAQQDNVNLVESWSAFKGRETTLIGGDGLHPSAEGYQVLAATFMTAIESKLELSSTTSFPSSGRGSSTGSGTKGRTPQAPAARIYKR